jgi:hypothetical protein
MGGHPMADVLGVFTTLRPWIIACGIGMLLAGPARACVERVWVTRTGSNEIHGCSARAAICGGCSLHRQWFRLLAALLGYASS